MKSLSLVALTLLTSIACAEQASETESNLLSSDGSATYKLYPEQVDVSAARCDRHTALWLKNRFSGGSAILTNSDSCATNEPVQRRFNLKVVAGTCTESLEGPAEDGRGFLKITNYEYSLNCLDQSKPFGENLHVEITDGSGAQQVLYDHTEPPLEVTGELRGVDQAMELLSAQAGLLSLVKEGFAHVPDRKAFGQLALVRGTFRAKSGNEPQDKIRIKEVFQCPAAGSIVDCSESAPDLARACSSRNRPWVANHCPGVQFQD